MDSGFWSAKTIRACRRHRIRYWITVRQTTPIRQVIAAINQDAWVEIVYPDGGLAQVAETRHRVTGWSCAAPAWSAPRPSCFPTGATTPLSPTGSAPRSNWTPTTAAPPSSSCAFATSKPGSGCGIIPPGKFAANAAGLLGATLAHNLLRWVAAIGLGARGELVVAKTLRRTMLSLPGRLTRSARRLVLQLPVGWPGAAWFALALARLRGVAYAT
jgi:hypothetical protein